MIETKIVAKLLFYFFPSTSFQKKKKRIFAFCYRDTASEIRCVSFSALGEWIQSDPEELFTDQYAKYIGWMLSDLDAEVRVTCLTVLTELYQREDTDNIQNFTLRFRDRIVEMSHDVDANVAAVAIELCKKFATEDILKEEQVKEICELSTEDNPAIRSHTGPFIQQFIQQQMKKTKGKH